MRRYWLLVVLVCVTLPMPASAGISIFGKKPPKPNPQDRVPELLKIVKQDGDENKRADACEELRQFDPAQFPDIVPTLIDALLNDKKPGVRIEAAHSLSKLRPVSQPAGHALETALDNDSSMRVRIQVRSALLSYHWAGYRSNGKKDDPLLTKEPPLLDQPGKGPMLTPPGTTILPARMTPVPQGPPLPPLNTQSAKPLPQGPSLQPPPAPLPAAPIPATPAEPKGPDLN